MKRGEVWWVSFDPSLGGEIQKTRPAVIVSNNAANSALNRVQVVPLSSAVHKCYPSETLVRIQNIMSKALADQITTVSKLRLKTPLGMLTHEEIEAVDAIIKLQLGLHDRA